MLQSALNYLSQPLFFLIFSVVVGLAYVAIWIVSLHELVRPGPRLMYRNIPDGTLDNKSDRMLKNVTTRDYSKTRNTSQTRTRLRKKSARVTRAASKAA